ncbi:hydroperoxide isomerase ALOXE3-like [Dunckerocampus dactyliophorus]|uniref:hydroperoxide isomerase ALOXE3-like n=1 Tax=Dunckerocampus dactyliophorus TaxID=161453 RepID=UPI00240742B4|nr:hydroperoxide isomerase ALOXE3-like [Dunckerocampus dactyliophorus]
MAEYKLDVTTGDKAYSGTSDHIYITLFGTEGQSERVELDNWGVDFVTGTTGNYTVKTSAPLGKLLLVKVEKDPYFFFSDNEWYCSKIVVTTPEGEAILFPCHEWLADNEVVELRGGRAMKVFEDDHPLLIEHRKKELASKKSLFQWAIMKEGLPYYANFDVSNVPAEVRMPVSRVAQSKMLALGGAFELKLKGMLGSVENWENIDDMKQIFWNRKTKLSEYVSQHWKEDDFFGFQFLNGISPNMIKRCSTLPANFPVTEEMVKAFLEEGSTLDNEIQKGNIFLYDQKKMNGIPGRMYNGARLQASAGLCLFYLNPEKKLKPIAIQLQQQPSEQNPIFLPSDSETDWLLAKMFIKNADMMDHQANHHFKDTHFLSEVWVTSLIRNFPVIHPIYKFLIPHFRWILHINAVARQILFGPGGPFPVSTLGLDSILETMVRSHAELTYSKLCLPENIAARGLESIPNFYYRDDGLQLWDMINSFVKAVVGHFYRSDSEVVKDSELQGWIYEIFTRCFLGNKSSGFPESFQTVEEVVKFITMVIFTVSGQHSAVNSGQFDYQSFIPNSSMLLRKPPPTVKGQSSMKTILETLPNVGESVKIASIVYVLSQKYYDFVNLGSYPEERFQEPEIQQMAKEFQAQLSKLTDIINARNAQLTVPYMYMNPGRVENGVTQ